MKRDQLEHIVRAAAAITGATELVVVGSQAILGQFPEAPTELLASMEADLFSLRGPRDAELIEGTIGELSAFHQSFGYYAHGVGEETAVFPKGWKERLVSLRAAKTGGATALCLEAHGSGGIQARRRSRERPGFRQIAAPKRIGSRRHHPRSR